MAALARVAAPARARRILAQTPTHAYHLDAVAGYRKLVDVGNRTHDAGLYVQNGYAHLHPGGNEDTPGQTVPEPATTALLGAGLGAVALAARRRPRSA